MEIQFLKLYSKSWPKFEQVSKKVPTPWTLEPLAKLEATSSITAVCDRESDHLSPISPITYFYTKNTYILICPMLQYTCVFPGARQRHVKNFDWEYRAVKLFRLYITENSKHTNPKIEISTKFSKYNFYNTSTVVCHIGAYSDDRCATMVYG